MATQTQTTAHKAVAPQAPKTQKRAVAKAAAKPAQRSPKKRASSRSAATDTTKPTGRGKLPPQASAAATAPAAAGGAVADLLSGAADNTMAFNPLIGIQRHDMALAAKALLKAMAATPGAVGSRLGGYIKELTAVAKGQSTLAADPKDRRFADPAWKHNPFYHRLMQTYVATQQELTGFIETAKLDKIEKGRAKFFASLVTDALAPSNWVLGNPAAVHKIVETGGGNLVKGLQNLLHDMRHNNGMPSMVDATPFKLGENIATSPGQVVYRHDMFELLQYAPTTPQVHLRPLVMSPPQVNKFYSIDLTPDKSLIKWTVDSGVQMFVISWRNPTIEHRHWSLEDYAMALDVAVDVARQITGSPDVNMWGSCSGGMTLAAYLGWLAEKGDKKVANTTWAVCVLNSEAALEDSTLGLFNTPTTINAAKARSRRKGLVHGDEMAKMFAWLRPNDLIWNYWVNNYLLGNKPPAYDILAWNADTTRLPGQYHCDLLDLVAKNPYTHPGTLEIGGLPIDFRKINLGAYVIGGITDHITPWRACYGTARLFGPKTTFVLANAGHLQSLLNPPGGSKSFFLAAPASVEDPEQWAELAAPTRNEGSWWPHWRTWMQAHSGERVEAPKKLGSRKHKPLGAAPGSYVFEA